MKQCFSAVMLVSIMLVSCKKNKQIKMQSTVHPSQNFQQQIQF